MESLILALYAAILPILITPANLPPAAEDPRLASLASEDCLLYFSWPGSGELKPDSKNRTEQLLADEEVQLFLRGIRRRFGGDGIRKSMPQVESPVPEIVRFVEVALTRPVGGFVNDIQVPMRQVGDQQIPNWDATTVTGGIVVNAGDQVSAVMKAAGSLALISGDLDLKPLDDRPSSEGKVVLLTVDDLRIYLGQKDSYLFAASSEEAVKTIVDTLDGRRQPPRWYDEIRQRLAVPRPTKRIYVDLQRIRELSVVGIPGPAREQLARLGWERARRLAIVSGLDETAYVTKTFLDVDLTDDVDFPFPLEPLTAEQLRWIPADCTFAVAGKLNFETAFDVIFELSELGLGMRGQRARAMKADFRRDDVQLLVPPEAEIEEEEEDLPIRAPADFLQEAEAVGVPLERSEDQSRMAAAKTTWKELFASLGSTWRLYNSPGEGGLLVTGTVAIFDVEDLPRFQRASKKLGVLVRAEGFQIRSFSFRGKTIHYAAGTIKDADDVALPFAWMIDDGQLFLTVSPQILKGHIRRRSEQRLVDLPEVSGVLRSGDSVLLSYVDSPSLYRLAYSGGVTAVPLIGVAANQLGIDYPIHEIPSLAAISPHVRPGVASIRRVDGGVIAESRRTLPFNGSLLWMQLLLGVGTMGIGF